jgi:ABC-2 type transport system ATP-binding protein
MQLVTGLFVADSGTIRILGMDASRDITRALKSLGVVFQQSTLDLELTVEANLLYHTDLHGIPRKHARERIDTLLARFDLTARRGDRARTLSGGNRRRVELARSLLHQPKLLLMDEATVGLDPASRFDILSRIMEMRDDGTLGVLWTTHLIDEVEHADRVLVLHWGRLLFDGPPALLVKERGGGSIDAAFLRLTGDGPTARVALVTGGFSRGE